VARQGAVLREVNKHRARHGKRKLKGSASLRASAAAFARTLRRTGRFGHAARIHADRKFVWLGEVLAKGPTSPRAVVDAWMNSPPHRAILLSDKARKAGFARKGNIWVGHLGRLGR
jgi:uncharacterized protein YkwD